MVFKKRLLITTTLVLLLLLSMFSTAAACKTVDWTVKVNGEKIPVKLVTKDGENLYRVEIPLENGQFNRKIIIYYRINLRTGEITPVPAPPEEEPAPEPIPDPPPPPVPEPDPPEPPAPEPEPEPEPDPPESPDPEESILTAEEQQMLNLVNQERKQRGLNELKIHEGLVKLARLKSKDMINLGYFAHQSPTYGSPFDMMRNAGIAYTYAGENLAGAPTVARAHTSLMNSPGHRANILNPNYTHVGIGIVNGGNYGKMFTQMFIKER
ncbi:MAG: sporulation protein [Firmicutes bacterium]|jgi:uncharacterized YkwD family protein|nr:sporulation protein [Bacillota bacterium]